MPEDPSGTGAQNQDPAGQGNGDGDGAPEGQQQGQGAQAQNLAREAAKWRTKYRETETQLGALRQELETLKSQAQTPADQGEIAQLKRTIGDLTEKFNKERERATAEMTRARTKTIQAGITGILAEGKVLDAAAAKAVLGQYASLDDDDVLVFTVTGDDGEARKVPATLENVRKFKLLSDIFFPSEGAAGSGSRGGSRQGTGGIDLERAKTDIAYYEANKDKIKALRRGQTVN